MIRRAEPVDETATLARLAEDVDRLTSTVARVTDLDLPQVIASHSRALSDLGEVVARLSTTVPPKQRHPLTGGSTGSPSGPGSPGGPSDGDGHHVADPSAMNPAPAWLTVTDPAVAVGWLSGLSVWVPRVWQPYLQTRTPDCWPWHPAVVAELLVVAHLWDEAVATDEAGAAPLAAWQDRWRPGAAARIGRLMTGCERAHGRHKNPRGQEHHYDIAYLDEVAHWWATTHGTDPNQPAPGLRLDLDRR